jgi:hypothetical protein
MARIRLYVRQHASAQEARVIEPGGAEIRLPVLRVIVHVRIGERALYPYDAIVDPGAPLTVVPEKHWRQFAADVEWLSPSPNYVNPRWLTEIRGKTGGSCPCRVGRVVLAPFDLGEPGRPMQFLPATRVIALFEQGQSGDDRMLVGLYSSVLEDRELRVRPTAQLGGWDAWLEEVGP